MRLRSLFIRWHAVLWLSALTVVVGGVSRSLRDGEENHYLVSFHLYAPCAEEGYLLDTVVVGKLKENICLDERFKVPHLSYTYIPSHVSYYRTKRASQIGCFPESNPIYSSKKIEEPVERMEELVLNSPGLTISTYKGGSILLPIGLYLNALLEGTFETSERSWPISSNETVKSACDLVRSARVSGADLLREGGSALARGLLYPSQRFLDRAKDGADVGIGGNVMIVLGLLSIPAVFTIELVSGLTSYLLRPDSAVDSGTAWYQYVSNPRTLSLNDESMGTLVRNLNIYYHCLPSESADGAFYAWSACKEQCNDSSYNMLCLSSRRQGMFRLARSGEHTSLQSFVAFLPELIKDFNLDSLFGEYIHVLDSSYSQKSQEYNGSPDYFPPSEPPQYNVLSIERFASEETLNDELAKRFKSERDPSSPLVDSEEDKSKEKERNDSLEGNLSELGGQPSSSSVEEEGLVESFHDFILL